MSTVYSVETFRRKCWCICEYTGSNDWLERHQTAEDGGYLIASLWEKQKFVDSSWNDAVSWSWCGSSLSSWDVLGMCPKQVAPFSPIFLKFYPQLVKNPEFYVALYLCRVQLTHPTPDPPHPRWRSVFQALRKSWVHPCIWSLLQFYILLYIFVSTWLMTHLRENRNRRVLEVVSLHLSLWKEEWPNGLQICPIMSF